MSQQIKNSHLIRPFQKEAVEWLEEKNGNGLVAIPMGGGKCLISLLYIAKHNLKTLVICPNSIKLVWADEVGKWIDKTCSVINAKDKELDFSKDITVINYDIVKKYLSELQAQDFDCIVLDECFPYNTPILTNKGMLMIGDIVENNLKVLVASCNLSNNIVEHKKIIRKIKNPLYSSLIKIKHSDGEIICTKNHKIFIEETKKYVKAKDIKSGTHMRMVQKNILYHQKGQSHSKILQSSMCNILCQHITTNYKKLAEIKKTISQKKMLLVQKNILHKTTWRNITKTKILFKKMLCTMASQSEKLEDSSQSNNEGQARLLEGEKTPRNVSMVQTSSIYSNTRNNRKNKESHKRKNIFIKRGEWTTYSSTKKTMGGTKITQKISRICNFDKRCKTLIYMCSQLLQGRYWNPRNKARNRGRWQYSQTQKMEIPGQTQNRNFEQTRVESVEILESRNSRRFTKGCQRNSTIYNLEIEDNHNYFANNILVSNCSFIKSTKAARSKAVKQLNIPKKILLSGTPITNSPMDLWNQLNYLNPTTWNNWLHFRNQYITGYVHHRFHYFVTTGTRNIAELSEKIRPFVHRKRKEEILKDLPAKIYNKILINIDGEYAKQYNLAMKSFKDFLSEYTELTKVEIRKRLRGEAFTKVQLLKQICSEYKVQGNVIKSVVENILENNPDDKIVIFSQYRKTVKDLNEQLKESVTLHGGMDIDERKKSVDALQNDPKTKIFIATIQAGGMGLTLTRASHVIFVDLPWSPSEKDQSEDRCHRITTHKPVNIFYVMCQKTIDEAIYGLLNKKQSTINQIIDGQEYKKPINIFNKFIENEMEKL